MPDIECVRCGESAPALEEPPLPTDLGERIHGSICQNCWEEWKRYQTALINHYGLDVREKDAREFLTQNMEAFCFEQDEAEDIDTSKEGQISW